MRKEELEAARRVAAAWGAAVPPPGDAKARDAAHVTRAVAAGPLPGTQPAPPPGDDEAGLQPGPPPGTNAAWDVQGLPSRRAAASITRIEQTDKRNRGGGMRQRTGSPASAAVALESSKTAVERRRLPESSKCITEITNRAKPPAAMAATGSQPIVQTGKGARRRRDPVQQGCYR